MVVNLCMVCESRPTVRYHRTIGAQKYQLNVVVRRDSLHPNAPAEDVELQVWDIAGGNDFTTLRESFFAGVSAGILLFSSDSRASYSSVRALKAAADKEIRRQRGDSGDSANIDWVLVQHKVDWLAEAEALCPEPEQAPGAGEPMDPGCVSVAEGRQLAESIGGLQFFQTSTDSPPSLQAPFAALASTIFYRRLAEAAKISLGANNTVAGTASTFESVSTPPACGLRFRDNPGRSAAGNDVDFRQPRLDNMASPTNQPFKLRKPAASGFTGARKFKDEFKAEIYTFICLALSFAIFVLTFYIILPAEGVKVDPLNEVTQVTTHELNAAG